MACPQNRQMRCGSMKPATDQSSSDLVYRARSGSSLYLSTMLNPGGRHSAREDNDQPPLHRNSTARSCCGCPGAATKRGNHMDIVTPWQCCYPQRNDHNSVSGRRKDTSLDPPTLQPCLITMWLWAVFHFENWTCWKELFANSRPRKSGEFTTSCHALFGIPQRLPEMAMATATLCEQQRRVFGKFLKIALL